MSLDTRRMTHNGHPMITKDGSGELFFCKKNLVKCNLIYLLCLHPVIPTGHYEVACTLVECLNVNVTSTCNIRISTH